VDLPGRAAAGRVRGHVGLPLCAREWLLHETSNALMKKKVLFVCIHNSARSQMAEAFLNQMCGAEFEAHSAGLEPGQTQSHRCRGDGELGLDISGHQTKAVSDFIKSGTRFPTSSPFATRPARNAARFFPGVTTRLHWSFPDPSSFQGTHEEKTRPDARSAGHDRTESGQWCDEVCSVAVG
jgi:arsenate reductase